LQSDELFPSDTSTPWPLIENRINRLLEAIVQLRNANAALMKENVILQNQLKEKESEPSPAAPKGPSPEESRLRQQYDEALDDLKKVKTNLQRLETLAREFHLEDSETLTEGPHE
jgi:phage shock protein A